MEKSLRNIIILGLGFMFIFAAFQTCAMVQKNVTEAIANATGGNYTGNGYVSSAIIYTVFAIFSWIGPSVIIYTGPKWAMIISSLTYSLFMANFLVPMTWGLYAASALIGAGASVLWSAQGNYYALSSSPETAGRNSAVFWALLQCSLLLGNFYEFVVFRGDPVITDNKRYALFGALTVISLLGTVVLAFLGDPVQSTTITEPDSSADASVWTVFKRLLALFFTPNMLLLSLFFAFMGFQLAYMSGVFPTSVGHTISFGDDQRGYIGVAGLSICVGEVFGGSVLLSMERRFRRCGRRSIVLFGLLLLLAVSLLSFLLLPSRSPIEDSSTPALLTHMSHAEYLAFFIAFLLGLSDVCFNTQLMDILGSMYKNDSAHVFALFKFTQGIAAASAFYYSDLLELHWQLLLLTITSLLGVFGFAVVDGRHPKTSWRPRAALADI